jgi:trimeric autotransporter adhesin
MKNAVLAICSLALIAGFSPLALAQAPASGTGIMGTVTDNSGALFPNAVVTIGDAAGKTQTVITNEHGEYRLPGLAAGSYTVSIASPGFKEFRQSGVTVVAGEMARVDATLAPAEAASSVEVQGSRLPEWKRIPPRFRAPLRKRRWWRLASTAAISPS